MKALLRPCPTTGIICACSALAGTIIKKTQVFGEGQKPNLPRTASVEPGAPCRALACSGFLSRKVISGRGGSRSSRRVRVSASSRMDLALRPTPAPAHCTGTRLPPLRTRWISEIFPFFVWGPVWCPPKIRNGGSERLAGAALPRPVRLQGSPLLVPRPRAQNTMSITVSPELTGESWARPGTAPPSPRPQPGSRSPRTGKPPPCCQPPGPDTTDYCPIPATSCF